MIKSLENRLNLRLDAGNLRELKLVRPCVDFSSNDYLGLARSSTFAEYLLEEWKRTTPLLGRTGSRLLAGNTSYAQDLEERIAQFHGQETGLLFNCGYMANMGVLSAVAGRDDVVFFDSRVHASIHAGVRLSGAKAFPFRHNDLEHLERRLKTCSCQGNRFICVESIYSTDGSKASLKEICVLAKRYDAHVIVDEAHAIGVCGPEGRGLVAAENLTQEVFAVTITFGKALGVHGAIVVGSQLLKQTLVNFAPSYIYTCALPPYALVAIKCSYDFFPSCYKERTHLERLVSLFKQIYPASLSETHIQPIFITGNEQVKAASNHLLEAGFDVRPLMSPTVRRGEELLRVCLHAFNTHEEVHNLLVGCAVTATKGTKRGNCRILRD